MTTTGRWIRKRVPDAEEVLARIAWLRGHGVPTPEARAGIEADHIEILRVEGVDGRRIIDPTAPHLTLPLLLAPLRALARLPAAGLDLPCWNPAPLIEPRLASGSALAGRAANLWKVIRPGLTRGGRLLHGDYHPGQLLFGPRAEPWMIDWDDMALGPPAVDRLNLLVYLSSISRAPVPLWRVSPDLGPADREERLIAAALLLRRALKLHERSPASRRPSLLIEWCAELMGRASDR